MLASDARLVADGGGKAQAALNVIEGADRVARFLAAVRKGFTDEMLGFEMVNGLPGLILKGPPGLIRRRPSRSSTTWSRRSTSCGTPTSSGTSRRREGIQRRAVAGMLASMRMPQSLSLVLSLSAVLGAASFRGARGTAGTPRCRLPRPHAERADVAQGRSIHLFNGKDLSGWTPDVPARDADPKGPPSFVVRNGMLVSLGKPAGHLVTDARYRDYRLEVEYRFPGKGGNCGVLVHASTPRALYKMFPQSIEVQMMSGDAGDFWVIHEASRSRTWRSGVPARGTRSGAPPRAMPAGS